MARPTKLTPELIERAKQYLESCEDVEIEKGSEERPIYALKVKLPTKGGMARFLDVSRDSLYEWAKESDEFSDIIESLSAEQEDKLINNGLSGDYNPTIAKVLLSKHGYSEKQEVDLTNKGDKFDKVDIDLDTLAREMSLRLRETKTDDKSTD